MTETTAAETTERERVRVNFMVDPETKDRWDVAAEDSPEHASLSQLIRTAVEHELSGGPGGVPDDLADRLDHLPAMADTLDGLAAVVASLDERVKDVEADLRVQQNDFRDLANDILDAMEEADAKGLTLDQLAQRLDVERWEAFAALDQVQADTNLVEEVPDPNFGFRYTLQE